MVSSQFDIFGFPPYAQLHRPQGLTPGSFQTQKKGRLWAGLQGLKEHLALPLQYISHFIPPGLCLVGLKRRMDKNPTDLFTGLETLYPVN